jgi:hypothetical protein
MFTRVLHFGLCSFIFRSAFFNGVVFFICLFTFSLIQFFLSSASSAWEALNKHETSYCTTKKELLAVIVAIKNFHPYVYGQNVLLRTDNSAVSWMQSQTVFLVLDKLRLVEIPTLALRLQTISRTLLTIQIWFLSDRLYALV